MPRRRSAGYGDAWNIRSDGGSGLIHCGGKIRDVAFWAALLLAGALAAAPAAGGTPAGVLVVGQVAEPRSLDPHTVTSLNDFRILANIYDGLVRFRPGSLDVAPSLAESWDVSDDGLTYTFHLRRGVRFHDGTPFDARAVTFNFGRLLDPRHPYHDTGPFPLAFFFDSIAKVEAVDAETVRLRLKAPFAPLLANLAYPTGFMVSPAAVRRYGRDFGRHPSGTGPYRFATWESGIRVVLERFAGYWRGRPPLKAVVFRPLRDANTRTAAFLAGGIDVMMEVPPDVAPIIRDRPGMRLYQATGPHLWFLILNAGHGPFRDRRLRQAVNYAIDKRALVERVLQGAATVADGPVPAAFAWAHDDAEPYPFDPARARRLIGDAGYDGRPLTLLAPESGSGMLQPVTMATAIQADLARVGLKVLIRTYEWNSYLARVNHGLGDDADMAEMAWMTDDPDTLPYLALRSAATPANGGFNSGAYANPEVDRLIEAARRATDRDVRADLYKRLQRIVRADAPWAFVASWKQAAAVSARVTGFRLEPSFLLDLRGVAKPR